MMSSKPKHLVLVAGEESGDMHAAVLIKQLKTKYPDIKITGIGGRHMQEAGAFLIADLAQFGVTGLTEVLRHVFILGQAFSAIKQWLKDQKPDLLILVDYPGFNLRLAAFAKKQLGLKILYYISPQIWAWKAKRIHLIKKYIDRMAIILPFEKSLYQQEGIAAQFVGHPLVSHLETQAYVSKEELGVPHQTTLIALLPGSRTHEIERHLPILKETVQRLLQHSTNFHFVLPIASTINPDLIKAYFINENLPIRFIIGQATACMNAADFVIVASGTASLECALLKKPMCIIYKSSLLTYIAATQLIRINYLGLCNILANRMIVPEFLQYDCTAAALSQYIVDFFKDPHQAELMKKRLAALQASLSHERSDCSLLDLVVNEIDKIDALI